jgi:hypothetical protein
MRVALRFIGVLAVIVGLIWIGQGTGLFPYPASSFMIGQAPWVYYGAGLAILGIVGIVLSRRR